MPKPFKAHPAARLILVMTLVLAGWLCLPPTAATAADPQAPASPAAPDKPEVKLVPIVMGHPAGRSTPVFLLLRLPRGFELEKPSARQPLKLSLAETPGVTLRGAALLPPMEGDTYRDKAVLELDLKIAADSRPGRRTLSLSMVLPRKGGQPYRLTFSLPVEVMPAGAAPRVANQRMLDALMVATRMAHQQGLGLGKPPVREGAAPEEEDAYAGKSLWLILGLVFLGGLGLNLTPCVYPLIPITVSVFGGRARGSRGVLLANVLLYWLGLAVTYSVLGVAVALGGKMLGSALTSPAVLWFIALVMVVMASSMFGLWEIKLPAALNRLAGSDRGGAWGSLFMGLTVGLLAAPCVGPFVVGLLGHVAQVGQVWYGLLVFFVLSLGLGLPLSVLALFSGALNRLPGAGEWMLWVRKFFGVVLLVMAAWVLRPVLGAAAGLWLPAGIAILGGLYLALVEQSGSGRFVPVKRVAGLAMVLAAAGFLWWSGGAAAPGGAGGEIVWQPFTPARLAQAAKEGRPVLVDVRADWCPPCRRLEADTFPHPQVQAALRNFTALRVDVTQGAPPEAREHLMQWRVRGVPTLLFFDAKGRWRKELTIVGFVEPAELLRQLKRVRAAGEGG